MSSGVVDCEFEFGSEDARRKDGVFRWGEWDDEDVKREELEVMSGDEVLRRMELPLVAVVLSYDRVQGMVKKVLDGFVGAFSEAGVLLGEFEKVDERKPKEAGEVLRWHATNTRGDYGGLGLAKKLTGPFD